MSEEPNIVARAVGEALRHSAHCDRDPVECSYEALVREHVATKQRLASYEAQTLSNGQESPVAWAARMEREAVVAFLRAHALEMGPLGAAAAIGRGEHREGVATP